jgi:hypothetical protein
MTDEPETAPMPEDGRPAGPEERRSTADPGLLHGGSGQSEPPDGPPRDEEADDDLLNGGSGDNDPSVEPHDGQVYGG